MISSSVKDMFPPVSIVSCASSYTNEVLRWQLFPPPTLTTSNSNASFHSFSMYILPNALPPGSILLKWTQKHLLVTIN